MSRRRFRKAKRFNQPTTFQDEVERRLEEKLFKWLFQQPEWVHVLASDRHRRRRFALYIADRVTRVSVFVSNPPPKAKPFEIRVGTGDKEAQVPASVQASLEDAPGPTRHDQWCASLSNFSAPCTCGGAPDPEGDEKDRIQAAVEVDAEIEADAAAFRADPNFDLGGEG